MKSVDQNFMWVFLIAVIAVIVGSGQTDTLIQGVGRLLSGLISVVASPQGGANHAP